MAVQASRIKLFIFIILEYLLLISNKNSLSKMRNLFLFRLVVADIKYKVSKKELIEDHRKVY